MNNEADELKRRIQEATYWIKERIVVYSDGTIAIPYPLDGEEIKELLDKLEGRDKPQNKIKVRKREK